MVSRQEARQQLRELEGRRKTIEDEMEALTQTLSAGAGVRGSLVDSEGFPRADVDVHQTLIHRNRMACATSLPRRTIALMQKRYTPFESYTGRKVTRFSNESPFLA